MKGGTGLSHFSSETKPIIREWERVLMIQAAELCRFFVNVTIPGVIFLLYMTICHKSKHQFQHITDSYSALFNLGCRRHSMIRIYANKQSIRWQTRPRQRTRTVLGRIHCIPLLWIPHQSVKPFVWHALNPVADSSCNFVQARIVHISPTFRFSEFPLNYPQCKSSLQMQP